jgi:methionyl-tRNA synthetase
MKMKHYITTPIYYVNDAPHIGHAYTSIVADFYARKMRESGEAFFLTGTDEHGQKIEKSAKAKGKDPLEFCNEVSAKFKAMTADFNISNDDFIRTTEQRHIRGVQAFWQKLEQNGWIYKGKYEGWYAIRDEAFYSEEELINGKAPTGAEVEWQSEESYFFKLSKFTEILLEVYKIEGVIFPQSRLNEVKAFVSSGLKDLSISRTSFSWGIKVPNDEKHVIYVWLDALTNYITALEGKLFNKFWADESKKIHFIGKDILRFHAVFWPAFLIAEKYKIGEVNMSEVLGFFKNFTIRSSSSGVGV